MCYVVCKFVNVSEVFCFWFFEEVLVHLVSLCTTFVPLMGFQSIWCHFVWFFVCFFLWRRFGAFCISLSNFCFYFKTFWFILYYFAPLFEPPWGGFRLFCVTLNDFCASLSKFWASLHMGEHFLPLFVSGRLGHFEAPLVVLGPFVTLQLYICRFACWYITL